MFTETHTYTQQLLKLKKKETELIYIPLNRSRPRQRGIEGPWFHADYKVEAILILIKYDIKKMLGG